MRHLRKIGVVTLQGMIGTKHAGWLAFAGSLAVIAAQAGNLDRRGDLIEVLTKHVDGQGAYIRMLELGLELQCPVEMYEEREI